MTPNELQCAAEQLYNAIPISFRNGMGGDEHNHTSSSFGVYALWGERKELLYIGYARTATKAKTAQYSGIKNRLHHHRLGGGSLGLLLLMVKIACTYDEKEWNDIASGKVGIFAKSQNYVRGRMSYTFFETATAKDAQELETWLHTNKKRLPLLSMLRRSRSRLNSKNGR